MNKGEFLDRLRTGLHGLPEAEAEERLSFYAEMIDDMTEDGLSEEEAVLRIGDTDEIIARIVRETPITTLVKEGIRPKRRVALWETILLWIGSPVWLSLLIALLSVILAVWAAIAAVVISLWSAFAACACGSGGGLVGGIVTFARGSTAAGYSGIAAGLVLAGLAILLFLLSRQATKGICRGTGKVFFGLKRCLAKGRR